jgi:hypothetical protein
MELVPAVAVIIIVGPEAAAISGAAILSIGYDAYKALAKWKAAKRKKAEKESARERRRKSRPADAPGGTRPIDTLGLSREQVHRIKDEIGAAPDDWVGRTPDGRWVTTDPETGLSVYH